MKPTINLAKIAYVQAYSAVRAMYHLVGVSDYEMFSPALKNELETLNLISPEAVKAAQQSHDNLIPVEVSARRSELYSRLFEYRWNRVNEQSQ